MIYNSNKLKKHAATCAVTLVATGLSFGIVACGGSGTETAAVDTSSVAGEQTTTSADAVPAGGPMAELTEEQVTCLENEGATVPTGPPQSGEEPSGDTGTESAAGAADPAVNAETMEAAAETCGVELPEPPSGGEMPQTDAAPETDAAGA